MKTQRLQRCYYKILSCKGGKSSPWLGHFRPLRRLRDDVGTAALSALRNPYRTRSTPASQCCCSPPEPQPFTPGSRHFLVNTRGTHRQFRETSLQALLLLGGEVLFDSLCECTVCDHSCPHVAREEGLEGYLSLNESSHVPITCTAIYTHACTCTHACARTHICTYTCTYIYIHSKQNSRVTFFSLSQLWHM